MKYFLLALMVSLYMSSCKINSLPEPSELEFKNILKCPENWIIGREKEIEIVDVYYCFGPVYVTGVGRFCDLIAYCKTIRGDTIAIIDKESKALLVNFKGNFRVTPDQERYDYLKRFNSTHEVSWRFVNVFLSVDSVYVVDLEDAIVF